MKGAELRSDLIKRAKELLNQQLPLNIIDFLNDFLHYLSEEDEENTLYKQIFDNLSIGVRVQDSTNTIKKINKKYGEYVSLSPENAPGLTCKRFICPRFCQGNTCIFGEIQSNKQKVSRTFSIQDRHFLYEASPLLDNKGKVNEIFETFIDITEAIQTKIGLFENEQKLKSFVAQSVDGVVIIDQHGLIVEWNHAMEQITGYKAEEIINKMLLDISDIAPEFLKTGFIKTAVAQLSIDQFLDGKKRWNRLIDLDICTKNKEIKHAQMTIFPIKMFSGHFLGGIVRDITKKKELEYKLQEYQSQLKSLLQLKTQEVLERENKLNEVYRIANEGMWEWFPDSGELFFSPSFYTILGYIPNEFEPTLDNWLSKIHIEDHSIILKLWFDISRSECDNFLIEYKFQAKNGEYRWMRLKGILVNTEKQKKYIGTHVDVHNEKLIYLALVKNEEKFRNIFNSALDIVTITDLSGNIVDANEIALKTLGITLDKSSIFKIQNFLDADERELLKNYLKTVIAKGSGNIEFQRIVNGSHTSFETYGRLISYEGYRAIIHITRDITEKKEFENKLFQTIIDTQENERRRFARDIHDDLGPQLSTIKLYINSLSSPVYDQEKKELMLRNCKDIIAKAIDSAKEIANDMMPNVLSDFGFIDAINSFCEKINLLNLIKLKFSYKGYSGCIKNEIAISLYRICTELINNSLKHGNASYIYLKLKGKNNNFRFIYIDNGEGFDFEESLKEKKGSGLSNIVSRIRSIDGKILVSNNKSGTILKILINQ